MKITFDGTTVEFRADRITNVEAMAIEKATGLDFKDWTDRLNRGSALAETALVWIARKRTEPMLQFGDVVYTSLSIEPDADEAQAADASDPAGDGDGSDEGSTTTV